MSGETWAGSFQIGKEVTEALAVAATRKIYFNPDGALSSAQDPRPHRFLVGRRDNVLDYTNGPEQAGGSVGMPVSADEMLEMLAITLQGGVSPTTPSGATLARLWTYKASAAVDSATIEWHDGANVWIESGVKGNQFTLTGAVADTNMISVDLFGTSTAHGSLTGALSDRVPSFMEGWQTRFYVDTFGSAFAQTPIPGTLINWNVQVSNNDERKYRGDNTLAARRVAVGELDVQSTIVFDAAMVNPNTSSPFGIEEFDRWKAGTKRGLTLEFLGPADGIEAGANEAQTFTITGTPTTGGVVAKILGINVALTYNSTSGAAQSAINLALVAAHGAGNTVTVSGGPWPATPLVVTFTGAQVSARDIPLTTAVSSTLDGGATVGYATTTPGRSGRKQVRCYIPGAWTAVNLGGTDGVVRSYEFTHQAVYDPTLAAMFAMECQSNRTTAF